MEQTHKILINRFFTGATNTIAPAVVQSNLQYENNYYYNPTGLPDIVVDYSNVRAFLSNENNQIYVQAYYSFLTSSSIMNSAILVNPNTSLFTPTAEFKQIYYNDEKLADSFNNFYNSSLLRGLDSNYSSNPDIFNTSIRNQLLSNNVNNYITQKVYNNYFFWKNPNAVSPAYSPPKNPFFTAGTPYYTSIPLDVYGGDRDNSTEDKIVEIPINTENYYINVLLTKQFTYTSRMAFEICDSVAYKNINQNNVYSQNITDIYTFSNYLNNINVQSKSLDNSVIISQSSVTTNSLQAMVNVKSETIPLPSQTGTTLIQCFVDPNFKTNENEYWNS